MRTFCSLFIYTKRSIEMHLYVEQTKKQKIQANATLKKNARQANRNLRNLSDPNLRKRTVSRIGLNRSRASLACRIQANKISPSRLSLSLSAAYIHTMHTGHAVTAFRRSISSLARSVSIAPNRIGSRSSVRHGLRTSTNGNDSIEKG